MIEVILFVLPPQMIASYLFPLDIKKIFFPMYKKNPIGSKVYQNDSRKTENEIVR